MKLVYKLLIIFVFPLAVIIASIISINSRLVNAALRELIEKNAYTELNLHTNTMLSFFQGRTNELRLIAESAEVHGGSLPLILQYLGKAEKTLQPQIEGLYYNEVNGIVHDTKGGTFSVRDRYYFPAISRGETVITKAITSRSTGRPIVLILVPVFDRSGKRTGAIGGTVLINGLLTMVRQIKLGTSGFAILVDEDQQMLSGMDGNDGTDPQSGFRGFEKTEDNQGLWSLIGSMSSASSGSMGVRYKTNQYLAYYHAIPVMKWSLALLYREEELLHGQRQIMYVNIIIALIALALIVLSVYGFRRFLLNPILSLVSVHTALGKGNLSARAEISSGDEIGMLSRSFNNMAEQLHLRSANLEREILERTHAEEALKESRNYLNEIINSVADPIFVKDRQHRWMLLNDAMCRLMGHDRETLIGKSDYDFIPANEADVFWEKDEMVFSTGLENVNEEEFTDAAGNHFIIITKKVLYTNAEGEQYIVGVIQDITDRKLMNEQLRKSLQEKETLLRELYHRTKNNMQVICSLLSIEGSRKGREASRSILEEISLKIRTMAMVHQKLYETSNLNNIELLSYLRDVASLILVNRLPHTGNITADISGDSVNISIDNAIPLGLVVNELITNTTKHAFPDATDGRITISVAAESDSITLIYGDSGIGLPQDYDQGDKTTLGMVILDEIVRHQLNGTLIIGSGPGFNCTITIAMGQYPDRL